jgi:nitroreductase
MIQTILKAQHGTSGFGHLADKLIVITSELSNWGILDRDTCYVDAGIYAMNLLYSLHFYKIGACILSGYFSPRDEMKMRKVLSLPSSEVISCMIVIGKPSKTFYLCKSFRNNPETILTVYQ